MKIYLDDLRAAPEGWTIARTFDEFKQLVDRGEPIEAFSFDHDLGEQSPDGYTVIKWLAAEHPEYFSGEIEMHSHSANPVGRENIEAYIASCRRNSELLLEYKNRKSFDSA